MTEDRTKEIKRVDEGSIEANDWNPNEMEDGVFRRLCEEIEEEGFDQPIIVTTLDSESDADYRVVDGEHRLRAGRTVGMDEIPVIVRDEWDETEQKVKTVRRNLLKGSLDDEKFSELFEEVHSEIEEEISGDLSDVAWDLGFDDVDVMLEQYTGEILFEEEEEEISEVQEEEFDAGEVEQEIQEEMEAIENLEEVLDRIMNEYGDTIDQGFIYFAMEGEMHLEINMDDELMNLVEDAVFEIEDTEKDIRDLLKDFFRSVGNE